jgi:FKBP-type peptidyl-prolyl cis-trans isomerase
VLLAVLALPVAAACRDLPFEPENPQSVAFAPALGISLAQFTRLPSGTYYRDLAVGSGAVVETTSTVGVTYRGFLANGALFDSSSSTTPVTFSLAGTVAGFRNGLAGARQGSRRQLVIPPDQGYGNRTTANGRIPAGSVLVFDVNVVNVTTPPPTTTTARLPR